jgi:hypothetical protein
MEKIGLHHCPLHHIGPLCEFGDFQVDENQGVQH